MSKPNKQTTSHEETIVWDLYLNWIQLILDKTQTPS